jgi:hypothetical protein
MHFIVVYRLNYHIHILKMAVFWVVAPCSLVEIYRRFRDACCLYNQGDQASIIALITEGASTSETSANFYQTTRRNNPKDSHLHTRRRENLKSRIFMSCSFHSLHMNFPLPPHSSVLSVFECNTFVY